MIKVISEADRVVIAKIRESGQGHLFDHWNTLTPAEQKALLTQLRSLDLPAINDLIQSYREGAQSKHQDKVRHPWDFLRLPQSSADQARRDEARTAGEKALKEGKIAVIMAAGGLGIQLGYPSPKGTIPIGPVSDKSLYCLHAEKIRALGHRYRASIPLFVLTSEQTHDKTIQAFKSSEYFGIAKQDVRFLMQESLPVIDRRGRFFLSEPGQIAKRPNGHGNALDQLTRDEVFQNLEVRGIEHIFFFQVDNALVRIADPTFIGQHILGDCEMSSKAVIKEDPGEKLGIFCQCNGAVQIVEYNELSTEDNESLQENGHLVFEAGNVGIHALSMGFLRRIREEGLVLPYHFVKKKIACIDRKGQKKLPEKPNCIAFETFIFDALAWTTRTLVVETSRVEEFAPIKNAEGEDSPKSVRESLSRLYSNWLREAGATFPKGGLDGNNGFPVEISPLYALDAEGLRKKTQAPVEVTSDFYLE